MRRVLYCLREERGQRARKRGARRKETNEGQLKLLRRVRMLHLQQSKRLPNLLLNILGHLILAIVGHVERVESLLPLNQIRHGCRRRAGVLVSGGGLLDFEEHLRVVEVEVEGREVFVGAVGGPNDGFEPGAGLEFDVAVGEGVDVRGGFAVRGAKVSDGS